MRLRMGWLRLWCKWWLLRQLLQNTVLAAGAIRPYNRLLGRLARNAQGYRLLHDRMGITTTRRQLRMWRWL